MIARVWEGVVPASKAGAYLELMRTVALADYRSTAGNVGAWCLHQIDGEVARFQMLTFWTEVAAIKAFAGEDHARAKYYDFDDSFLIEKPEFVRHFIICAE
jgi:hypothetical protein